MGLWQAAGTRSSREAEVARHGVPNHSPGRCTNGLLTRPSAPQPATIQAQQQHTSATCTAAAHSTHAPHLHRVDGDDGQQKADPHRDVEQPSQGSPNKRFQLSCEEDRTLHTGQGNMMVKSWREAIPPHRRVSGPQAAVLAWCLFGATSQSPACGRAASRKAAMSYLR